MWRNYLVVAFRNLRRNKVFSLVNILGLAIGLTTCLLLMVYVLDEMS
jgi:putative ABC transport system permease protein